MRRAARTDRNHGEIRDALRACGVKVWDLSSAGGGVLDLLCWYAPTHTIKFLEVKDGAKRPSARRLTDGEEAFMRDFPEHSAVVLDVAGALAAMGVDAAAVFGADGTEPY